MDLIPKYESKFSAQTVEALHAAVFVKMQCDLTIGASSQTVTGLFELTLDRFVAVEFAVHDDMDLFILVRNGLISRRKIDDAQTGVAEGDPAIGTDPIAETVGAAMIEASDGVFQCRFRDGITTRKHGDDTAHLDVPLFQP